MNVKNVAITAVLLAALGALSLMLAAAMSYFAHETTIGEVRRPATSTPSLTDGTSFAKDSESAKQTPEVPAPEPTVRPTSTPAPYNPNSAMYLVFAGFELSPGFGPLNDRTITTLEKIRDRTTTLCTVRPSDRIVSDT